MEYPEAQDCNLQKTPRFKSKGRNGFIRTTGVSVLAYGGEGDEHEDRTVTLEPINSRGDVSDACRLALALNDVPAVIDALQEVYRAATREQSLDEITAHDEADPIVRGVARRCGKAPRVKTKK
jgi:hypothetical protein